jgi:hypothetical protein
MSLILIILLKVFCVESKYIPSKHEYKTLFVKIGLKKNVYFRCFLCAACLSASLIMHVSIFEQHASLMFGLQHDFELSTLPSIQSNGQVGGLC